jgi:hypothetical protein
VFHKALSISLISDDSPMTRVIFDKEIVAKLSVIITESKSNPLPFPCSVLVSINIRDL